MPSITRQRVGKYTYLNESVSFWDPVKKRPDNHKTRIGKIDYLTGEPVYLKEYLNKLTAAGHCVEGMRVWNKSKEARVLLDGKYRSTDEVALAVLDSVRDFGTVYFLREYSERIGLLNILRDALPDVWEKVFCLASYLVVSDKPVMYCESWVASSAVDNVGSMSSQRISELLVAFGLEQRNRFYRLWYDFIREHEYIALDTTSVSSHSTQISAVEWGHNKDGENLPQVNICMLFGEDSRLPVYQTIYGGSLRDVSTLRATLSEFSALTGTDDIMTVMDKGFFSANNVNMLLAEDEGKPPYRFLVPVPFSSNFARSQVESEKKDIDSLNNVILTSDAPIRGICKLRNWREGVKLNTHVFFNPEKALKDRNELFGYVTSLQKQAVEDPLNKKLKADYRKYLIVRKSRKADKGVTVSIREDVVFKELETVGWFVLVSNHIENAQRAYDIYMMKDIVEKGFMKYKSNLGLDRLRVHSDERMQNKVFVAFIALIIRAAIHETMKKEELFKRMTLDQLIITLGKLKVATVNGKTILRPATKEQKTILEAFGISLPDYNTLKHPLSVPKKRGRKPKAKNTS